MFIQNLPVALSVSTASEATAHCLSVGIRKLDGVHLRQYYCPKAGDGACGELYFFALRDVALA